MFFNFDHAEADFTDEQWDDIPRTDKVIIRDFFLNDCNVDQTMLYGYYETDFKVRQAVHKYELRARPRIALSLARFHLPHSVAFA